jgi:hypothetical protein
MTIGRIAFPSLILVALIASSRCGGGSSCDLVPTLDAGLCNPATAGFSLNIDNPFFPLVVGHVSVLEGSESGKSVRLLITVLDETEVVAGVTTRVVEERESNDGELVEVSRNFFAQTAAGNVCYFGEAVDNYENGSIANHDGQWRAGVNGAQSGLFMPAGPTVGMIFQMEDAPSVAEDRGEVVALGESSQVPAGTFTDTLRTNECTPLESNSDETKMYARGVGPIQDSTLRLVSF